MDSVSRLLESARAQARGSGAAGKIVSGVSGEHAELAAFEGEFFHWLFYIHGIAPGEAGGAVLVRRHLDAGEHALKREVVDRVNTEVAANLFDGATVRDEFLLVREVDPKVAGVLNLRAGDAQMDRGSPRIAERADLAARGGAADNGILDDDQPFPRDRLFDD